MSSRTLLLAVATMLFWTAGAKSQDPLWRFSYNDLEFYQLIHGPYIGGCMVDHYEDAVADASDAIDGIFMTNGAAANSAWAGFTTAVNNYRQKAVYCNNINFYCEQDGAWLVDSNMEEYGWFVYNTLDAQFGALEIMIDDLNHFKDLIDDIEDFQIFAEYYPIWSVYFGSLRGNIDSTISTIETRLNNLDLFLQDLWEDLPPP